MFSKINLFTASITASKAKAYTNDLTTSRNTFMNCFKANLERIIHRSHSAGVKLSWQRRQMSCPLLIGINHQKSLKRSHNSSSCSTERDSSYWSLEDIDSLLQVTDSAPSFLEIVRMCERFAVVMTRSVKVSSLWFESHHQKSSSLAIHNQILPPRSSSLISLKKNVTISDTKSPFKVAFNSRNDKEDMGNYKGKSAVEMILESKEKSCKLVEVLNYPVEDISLVVAASHKSSPVQSEVKVATDDREYAENGFIASKALDVSTVAKFPSQITISSNSQTNDWQPRHGTVPDVTAPHMSYQPKHFKDCKKSQHVLSVFENLSEVDLNSSVATDDGSKQTTLSQHYGCYSEVGM